MKIHMQTIAAISTAPGTGGIGIIRLSGAESFSIADRVYRSPSKKRLIQQKSHTIHYGRIVDPLTGETVDEVLVMLMRAPHTYTGEDTVEINCHGGPYVERRILELLLRHGAEMAEPGEFSRRAFLNGKMDLSQAEAVMDLIASRSKMGQRASMEHLRGALQKAIEEYRTRLLALMARVEANIEYPEYEETALDSQVLEEETEALLKELIRLYETADSGRMAREGIRTVIVGRPNVGKSSLLNRLAGQERAIVTDIPGTTRDIIEEQIDFDGILLRIADTAGLHETEDLVEKIGIERTKACLDESDLILWMVEGTDLKDEALPPDFPGRKTLLLLNKADLTKERDLPENLRSYPEEDRFWISAKTGEGLTELKERIRTLFFSGVIGEDCPASLGNLRQKNAVGRAVRALTAVREAMEMQMPQDLLSIDFTDAYDALGEITGHSLKEDVVDAIFRRFCLGK